MSVYDHKKVISYLNDIFFFNLMTNSVKHLLVAVELNENVNIDIHTQTWRYHWTYGLRLVLVHITIGGFFCYSGNISLVSHVIDTVEKSEDRERYCNFQECQQGIL